MSEVEVRQLEPHCLDVRKFLRGRRIRSQYLPRKRWNRQHFHCMDLLARHVSRLGVTMIVIAKPAAIRIGFSVKLE